MAKRTKAGTKPAPAEIIRDEQGRFPPGVSGNPAGLFKPGVSPNPGGRPKVAKEIRDLAQCDSPEAYAKVAQIMRDDTHKNQLPAAIAVLKMAGVQMNAEAIQNPAPPPVPVGGPSVAVLEAAAGGPSGNLQ